MRKLTVMLALAVALLTQVSQVAAQCLTGCAVSAGPGYAAYSQTGYGPNTTGANTSSLLGGPATYAYGSSGGLPVLRCDYVNETYHAHLHGDYTLSATAPGNVVATLFLGSTSITTTITNAAIGVGGAWWDADATFVCASAGGSSVQVLVNATVTFQATGGVIFAMPVGRGGGLLTVAATNGAFTHDLQRTFTNGANTMRIEDYVIAQER